jgi:hypothetical protein
MAQTRSRAGVDWRGAAAIGATVWVLAGTLGGCAAFDPQSTAQQYAPSYYNQPYSSLTPEQKMHLEDHLANQSNQAWRTTASLASGVGRLLEGTGVLLFAARH